MKISMEQLTIVFILQIFLCGFREAILSPLLIVHRASQKAPLIIQSVLLSFRLESTLFEKVYFLEHSNVTHNKDTCRT